MFQVIKLGLLRYLICHYKFYVSAIFSPAVDYINRLPSRWMLASSAGFEMVFISFKSIKKGNHTIQPKFELFPSSFAFRDAKVHFFFDIRKFFSLKITFSSYPLHI